jgi:carboxypeptidase C (cathepsin A)
MVGLFSENGPYYINKEGELAQRQYSWNQRTTSIFVDSVRPSSSMLPFHVFTMV